MVVPRVCGGFDVGTEQVGRNQDLVMLEEYAAHGDGVTVGLIGVLPLGPLGIILGRVQRARAPALFGAVDAGGDELNDVGMVFDGEEFGWKVIGRFKEQVVGFGVVVAAWRWLRRRRRCGRARRWAEGDDGVLEALLGGGLGAPFGEGNGEDGLHRLSDETRHWTPDDL